MNNSIVSEQCEREDDIDNVVACVVVVPTASAPQVLGHRTRRHRKRSSVLVVAWFW